MELWVKKLSDPFFFETIINAACYQEIIQYFTVNPDAEDRFCCLNRMAQLCMGSSTETVAFQVYEVLKIDHEFLQFFWLGSKI